MVFCNNENIIQEVFIPKVTILILIDGFLQQGIDTLKKVLETCHNPYFNRWFSAIGCKKELEATTEAASEDTSEAGGSEATGFDVSGINDKAIYVYSWNDELGNRIDTYFRTKYPEYSDLVKYVNLNVSGTESEYPAKIQNAVDDGTEYPSVFASDESVMLSYADKDFTAPVSEAGITADMYANAYQYTVDFATVDGNLMACTWQATPGVLLYNKAMAEEVLGTSDPEKVQEMVSDWDGFFAVAEKIKAAGKYMVSGPDELKYPLLANKI